MIGVSGERPGQAVLLARGESLSPGAEEVADPVERVSLAASMTEGLLLEPAANVIHRRRAELDDVERVEHAVGVLELVIDRVLVSLERVQRRDLDHLPEPLAPLVQAVAVDRPGPAWRQCEQPRGGMGPRVRSTIPVSSFGPRRRGSRWCQMSSSTPKTCTPSNRDGSSVVRVRADCTWGQRIFQVVPSCRAGSWIVAPSRRSCPIAQWIARVLSRPRGAQTSGSRSRNVATSQTS